MVFVFGARTIIFRGEEKCVEYFGFFTTFVKRNANCADADYDQARTRHRIFPVVLHRAVYERQGTGPRADYDFVLAVWCA